MATWNINTTKNTATFIQKIKHGVDPTLLDLQNYLFTDDVFGDGRQLQNIAFSELVAQVWVQPNKSSAPTFSYPTKN